MLEAAIVRIMKSRKAMEHQSLISEVLRQVRAAERYRMWHGREGSIYVPM